ncbi:hypothetical protein GQ53DRAFT_749406 [Thozetella sp. PMI_491]|nr:hypothetical protein GQ53DRAFT_749406 [Thozetella sp. PMI_491]
MISLQVEGCQRSTIEEGKFHVAHDSSSMYEVYCYAMVLWKDKLLRRERALFPVDCTRPTWLKLSTGLGGGREHLLRVAL